MNYSIEQILSALDSIVTEDGEPIANATACLVEAQKLIKRTLSYLDGTSVRGRENIDTLLGCMMALETLAKGGEGNG